MACLRSRVFSRRCSNASSRGVDASRIGTVVTELTRRSKGPLSSSRRALNSASRRDPRTPCRPQPRRCKSLQPFATAQRSLGSSGDRNGADVDAGIPRRSSTGSSRHSRPWRSAPSPPWAALALRASFGDGGQLAM